MANVPVKPISELEVKSNVSENDKILILDSVSNEARLAPKDELKGDKGDTGPQGEQGIAGPQGQKGEKGDKGDVGEMGPRGEQGIQGIQGATGPKGATGEKGDKGDTGIQGPAGASIVGAEFVGDDMKFLKDDGTFATLPNAKTELKGDAGAKGDTGPQGPAGENGQPGPQGPKGDTGSQGPAGASINGVSFVGNDMVFTKDDQSTVTLTDAKTDLKGDQGEKGETGEKGDTGDDGEDGNGIASITSKKVGKITTVTITETKGNKTNFDIKDGLDGDGAGDVIGPDGANNGNVAVYDGISGKLIKDGGRLSSIAFSGITPDMAGDNIEITRGGSSGETAIKEGVDSINISNGVNYGLISFKTYGGTKQVSQEPILPVGYTQLEYIRNTIESYIDTGIKASGNLYIKTKLVNYFNGNSRGRWAFGGRNAYLNKAFGIFVDGNNGNVLFSYGNKVQTLSTYSSYPETAIVEIGNGSIKIGDITHTYTTSTFTSDYNIVVPGLNNGGAFVGGSVSIGETIIDDGTTRLHLIPAKNSSGEIGMYDLESQTFFTNAGTGTLIAGPEVIVEVPEGYTILEYLQASGNQYLDLEIPLIEDDEIELEAKIDTLGSSTQNIFGGITQAAENNIEIILSQGRWMIDWNNSVNATYRLTVDATTDKTRFILNKNRRAIYTGDTLLGEQVLTCPDSITTLGTFLFFVKGGTLAATSKFTGKVYSLKIKDKINLIPVKNDNGVLGMYDTINKIFYTNKGTGSFTAGPSVYPSIDNPVKILTNNGAVKYGYAGFPAGYTKLEYLQSTGTQYIDTGIKLDSTSVIDIKYDFVSVGFLFGSRAGTNSNYSGITNESASGNYNIRMGNKNIYQVSAQPLGTVEAHVESGNIVVNGAKVSEQTYGTNFFNGNCYLFTLNNNGAAYLGEFAQTKIREFSIAGKINLIPAKRDSDGELGMYDTISQTFFTNAGTGTFTAGAEIPKTIYTQGHTETITDEIGNTATVENLFKIGKDYVDSQEILTGNITRKVGVVALDGSEEWTYESQYTRFYAPISNLKNVGVRLTPMICTHFININDGRNYANVPNDAIFTGNVSTNYVFIKMTEYTTLAAFKEFLANQYAAGTPVILLYPLASETTEFVSGQTLSTVDGDNTIRVSQSSMEGLELKMEYMLPGDSKINFVNNSGFITESDLGDYVKFGDNSPDNIYTSAYDENGNGFELYPNSFYVENEDGDAEEYDFFGDYRIARLNETMRGFPVPERGDDISNILEILKRNKPVYFYEKNGEAYNIWVVQSFVSQVIKSYMNNKGEYLDVWVNDNGWECDGHTVANADLVYQQTYTWHLLPSNNTWDGSAFSQYRETSSSFTVNGNGLFRMGFEYKLKVKNTGQSAITVTLGNKLLNPRNIPTTVDAGKEVIFLFYSSHSTMSTMELAQRIERPLGGGGEGSSTYPFPSEGDDISEILEALANGNSVVLAEAPDGLETHYYTIESYYPEDTYLEAVSVLGEEKVYIYYADGEVSSIDREAFPYLKFSDVQRKNMTGSVAMMTAKQFGYYKDTATNFTINAEPNSDKYSMDKLFKVKNTGSNDITITLGGNIDNPMNIDTTVKAGEEVLFEFHHNTIGQKATLWRRTPDILDMSSYFNTSTQTSDNITEGDNNLFVSSNEKTVWSGKQDAINDLSAIRSGAGAGATALQPSAINDTAFGNTWDGDTTHAPSKNAVYDAISNLGVGDMKYEDFEVVGVSGSTISIGDELVTSITPSANIDLETNVQNAKEGMTYKLLINSGSTAYTVSLIEHSSQDQERDIKNPYNFDLTLTANKQTMITFFMDTDYMKIIDVRTEGESIMGGITKIFTLSSTSDLTTAQAIYDWTHNRGESIVRFDGRDYRLSRFTASELFWSCSYVYNDFYLYHKSLRFALNNGSITGITLYQKTFAIVTAMPATPDENTIYFEK